MLSRLAPAQARRQLARPGGVGQNWVRAGLSTPADPRSSEQEGGASFGRQSGAPSPALDALAGLPSVGSGKGEISIPTFSDIVQKYQLDDWRRAVPLGIVLGVPAFSQQWIVLSHETQLLACFMTFTALAWQAAAPQVNKYLSDTDAEELREWNLIEDEAIARTEAKKKHFENRISGPQDLQKMYDYDVWVNNAVAKAQTTQKLWEARDEFVQQLEKQYALEQSITRAIQAEIVGGAFKYVQAQVAKENVQKAALDRALQLLADPKAGGKKDIVADLYKQYFEEHKKRFAAASKGKSNFTDEDQLDLAKKITKELSG